MEFRTNSFENNCLRSQILIYKDASTFVERPSYRKRGLKKKCSVCKRMNHFASQRFIKTRGNVVKSDSESELDEFCLTLRSVNEGGVIVVHVPSDLKYALQLTSEIY